MHEAASNSAATIGLSAVVDLADRDDLFAMLGNDDVVRLSRLGGGPGFADADNVLKATGISTRRMMREGITALDLALEVLAKVEQCDVSSPLVSRLRAVRSNRGRGNPELQRSGSAGASPCQDDERSDGVTHVLLCHSHIDAGESVALAAQIEVALAAVDDRVVRIAAFNFGCSGFLRLLQEAVLLLEADRRLSRVILLNVETPETWHDASDRLFCGLVSAGATAAIVERGRGLPIDVVRADDFVVPANLRSNPRPLFHHELSDAWTFRGTPERRSVMRMNAEPVFLGGIELMLDNLRAAVAVIDRRPGDRVVVMPHQPSGKLLRALIAAARHEFPNFEFLNNLRLYGNSISATIPTMLARLPDVLRDNDGHPLRDGDHLILIAAGICMEAAADEMSAGFACLRWSSGSVDADHRAVTASRSPASIGISR